MLEKLMMSDSIFGVDSWLLLLSLLYLQQIEITVKLESIDRLNKHGSQPNLGTVCSKDKMIFNSKRRAKMNLPLKVEVPETLN